MIKLTVTIWDNFYKQLRGDIEKGIIDNEVRIEEDRRYYYKPDWNVGHTETEYFLHITYRTESKLVEFDLKLGFPKVKYITTSKLLWFNIEELHYRDKNSQERWKEYDYYINRIKQLGITVLHGKYELVKGC